MAIAFATAPYNGIVNPGTTAAATGSFSITVPSDADAVVVFVSTYRGTANALTSGSNGVTLGGASPDAEIGADSNTAAFMSAGWAFLAPGTGSKTVAWTFGGSGSDFHEFGWIAYKGVGSVRGTNSAQATSGNKSAAYTASSGDNIAVAFAEFGGSGAGTWTNATEVANGNVSTSYLSIANATPSGNVTITGNDVGNDGGIAGIVLVPSAVAATYIPYESPYPLILAQ
jgi:hypothetical protein